MTISIEILDLARASLGLMEVGTDSDAFTVREWADSLELSLESTRFQLQQGLFDNIFERKDVLRTMIAGSNSNESSYVERNCYKYIEET